MMNFKKASLAELMYLARYTNYRKLAMIELYERLIDAEGDWK